MKALSLPARLAVAVLAAVWLAACQNDNPQEGAGQTPAETASPEGALEASAEKFASAGPVRLTFQLRGRGFGEETTGSSGLRGQEVGYFSMTIALRGGQNEKAETIFLPPDLYVGLTGEGWYVLSPWNQGTRPDEIPDLTLEDPLLDYPALVEELTDVRQLPDEELDGQTYSIFTAIASLSALPTLAGPDARGDADVAIWLDTESQLPRKVDVLSRLAGGERIQATFEFLDYGVSLTLPEPPAGASPWRDLVFPDASCIGDAFEGCLPRQSAIQPSGDSACLGRGRRVCLLPLGQVSPDLIDHLAGHFRNQYGLEVSVMTPQPVPAEMADPLRQQIDVITLLDYMFTTFPEAHLDPEAVIIGVTPLDLYDKRSHFRYLFGIKGDFSDPKAVVSSMRMAPQFYSEPADQELFFSRMRKLVSKYVGLLYYGLPPSEDPESPMFDSILGPDDLDTMTEPLPVR